VEKNGNRKYFTIQITFSILASSILRSITELSPKLTFMNKLWHIVLSVFFVIGIFQVCFSQKYIADTLIVPFDSIQLIKFEPTLNVIDLRKEPPQFLSIYEKKKWLFFPVDQIILSKTPIAERLEMDISGGGQNQYQLDIYEFYINHYETMFKRTLRLEGSFELMKIDENGNKNLLGTFYYNESLASKLKEPVVQAYTNSMNTFKIDFVNDLNHITQSDSSYKNPGDYHFRKGAKIAPKNLYLSTDWYYGYTFWGMDAELWFSSPEPSKKFKRKTRMLRYLNYGERQSIALSAGVSQYNYRLTDDWIFQNKGAFLLGFNKWNKVETQSRTLEEMFLFQLSFSQKICLNKLDKNGFVFGAGLMEEMSYIIYNNPMVNVGLVVSLAYKL